VLDPSDDGFGHVVDAWGQRDRIDILIENRNRFGIELDLVHERLLPDKPHPVTFVVREDHSSPDISAIRRDDKMNLEGILEEDAPLALVDFIHDEIPEFLLLTENGVIIVGDLPVPSHRLAVVLTGFIPDFQVIEIVILRHLAGDPLIRLDARRLRISFRLRECVLKGDGKKGENE
jgi:hypothetical protein